MRTALVVATVLALFALPAAAQTDLAVFASRSHAGSTTDSSGTTISFDRGTGYGASLNHFWGGGHFSTELGVTRLRYDGRLALSPAVAIDTGRLEIQPITAIAQWHLAPRGSFDFYIGGGAAYVTARDLSSADLDALGIGPVNVENKTTWVANAGLAFRVMDKLAVIVDGKYIDYTPESGPSGASVKLDLKPTVVSAGLRWRF